MDGDVIQQGVHLSWPTHFFLYGEESLWAERNSNSGGVGIFKRVLNVWNR